MGTPTVALTRSQSGNNNILTATGRMRIAHGTFTFSASYATGGEVLDPLALTGVLTSVDIVIVEPFDGTRLYRYDYTNKKVLSYTALGTQSTSTTDLSAVTIHWTALGR